MHTDECCPSNDRGKALFCRWESANEALKRGEQMKTRRRRGQKYIYIQVIWPDGWEYYDVLI
jgi:hypothetical protein